MRSGDARTTGPEWLPREVLLGLLSEDSPRVLLSLPEENLEAFYNLCAHKVAVQKMGQLTEGAFVISHEQRVLYQGV